MNSRGFLVASDKHMEWLLPWWWKNYSSCNFFPVVFVDLGMSDSSKAWCGERGQVLSLQACEERLVSKELCEKWKKSYGESYEQVRKAWFQKPQACLLTPFEETVWMDLDCEVLSSLDGIFDSLEKDKELSVSLVSTDDGWMCNSGVVVFRKESAIMKKWAEKALAESEKYWGDDRILWEVLCEKEEAVSILSPIYHWRMMDGVPLNAKVIHWLGEWGKRYIAKYGGLKL